MPLKRVPLDRKEHWSGLTKCEMILIVKERFLIAIGIYQNQKGEMKLFCDVSL